MKKVLAVFMAILVLFATCSVAVMAEETDAVETTTVAVEEDTTRSIKNDDGLVVPVNFNQLKSSLIFKIFEKIISLFLGLFGVETSEKIDQEGATIVDEIGSALDERLTNLAA